MIYNHFPSGTLDLSKKDPVRIVLYVCLLGHLWLVHRQPNPSDVELSGLVTISIGLVQVKQLHANVFIISRKSSIALFFPAILFPTKIDLYFSGSSCACFGIFFILVPHLIVCALVHFSDLKRETSHYSI